MKTMIPPPICPHCGARFHSHLELSAHVRDDGDAGTRCIKLRRRSFAPPRPEDALTFDEVEAAGLDGTLRNM